MAPVYLRHRASDLVERMDDPNCSLRKLRRTYDQFFILNRLLAGWRRIYRRHLRRLLSRPNARVLDMGCGGGDVLAHLAKWADADGLDATFLGIDPDERAIEYAKRKKSRSNIMFRCAYSGELTEQSERFEVVISNHVLHHLDDPEFDDFLHDSVDLSCGIIVHNDIRRSDWAPILFQVTRLFFRDSFLVEDGLRSIRRAYTDGELASAAGRHWTAERLFPFRNLLLRRPDGKSRPADDTEPSHGPFIDRS